MKRNALTILAVAVVALGLVAWSALYTVSETQQALVLQFGEPIEVVKEPGLHVKVPFIQNVEFMDDRILDFDAPKEEVIASDKKRIVVDAFARYEIAEPLVFFRTVNNEANARTRLATVINSSLRRVLARIELLTLLSGARLDLMRQITELVNEEAVKFGVNVVDVRIKRADLPEENSQAVYRRMQAERERDAREARARGAEEAQKIRADADRQKTVLLAEARKQADILRGEGDGIRNRIYAEAFQQDPEFFGFYRTMQAYRSSLGEANTSMVLSPDSDFFRYFGTEAGATGRSGEQAGRAPQ
jgi:membrane protease subunit HflC